MGNGNYKEYEYDQFGNVITMREKIDNTIYTHGYSYDTRNNLITYTYPSGLTITNQYCDFGFIRRVSIENSSIWRFKKVTRHGHVSEYDMGAGVISTNYTY
ncbi:hypothetical protein LJC11_04075, partial [Bacteroidales bacterium OttesenSCG-928-I21]|nr:hypothetical protein [Bacteroidales bacterium OttesenSCG-928-I21]